MAILAPLFYGFILMLGVTMCTEERGPGNVDLPIDELFHYCEAAVADGVDPAIELRADGLTERPSDAECLRMYPQLLPAHCEPEDCPTLCTNVRPEDQLHCCLERRDDLQNGDELALCQWVIWTGDDSVCPAMDEPVCLTIPPPTEVPDAGPPGGQDGGVPPDAEPAPDAAPQPEDPQEGDSCDVFYNHPDWAWLEDADNGIFMCGVSPCALDIYEDPELGCAARCDHRNRAGVRVFFLSPVDLTADGDDGSFTYPTSQGTFRCEPM